MGDKMKTARFAALVKEVGRPELAVLWQKPEKDPAFKSALKNNRVLTVERKHPGGISDYGVVGFKQDKNASYLIFPHALDAYKDKRVVGIKYDLLSPSNP